MRRRDKFLLWYFVIFGVLGVIAMIPRGTLMMLLVTIPLRSIPGFLTGLSPTILIYSLALLPLWIALNAGRRGLLFVFPALLIPLAVAVMPGYLTQQQAAFFAARTSQNDFVRKAVAKPKSIELLGDFESGLFVYGESIGDKNASCNDICRRLLFNGEADWVQITRVPSPYLGTRKGPTHSVRFRIERRDSCPPVYPEGTKIEQAVRDRLVAGDCLITDPAASGTAEAAVRVITNYHFQHYPAKRVTDGPDSIRSVKDMLIEQSDSAGTRTMILRRTETIAQTTALPFYIGSEMHMQGGYNGPIIGREQKVMNAIDLAPTLRATFGYAIAEIAPPAAEDGLKVAEKILSLPRTVKIFSAAQQQAIDDQIKLLQKKLTLADTDVELIRRVIADDRIDSAQLGVTLMNLFRRHRDRLTQLIPVAITRLKVQVPERVGHYQNSLGWGVAEYPAEALIPYRSEIIYILEQQTEWPIIPLLSRVAELGGEPADLIGRRMDAKSGTVRQFAAIAACRATAEAWPALEPLVIAHLPQQGGNRLTDEERPLLLALVRFGKKQMVEERIEKRHLFDEVRMLERLAKFDPGFDAKRCRDHL